MERKGGTRQLTATATVEELRLALSRTDLHSEQEKTLRMRYGIALGDIEAPLAQKAPADSAIGDELLLIETQLLRGLRARNGVPGAGASRVLAGRTLEGADQRTKDKIVRALRKKK
jgi:hypothetical protein